MINRLKTFGDKAKSLLARPNTVLNFDLGAKPLNAGLNCRQLVIRYTVLYCTVQYSSAKSCSASGKFIRNTISTGVEI